MVLLHWQAHHLLHRQQKRVSLQQDVILVLMLVVDLVQVDVVEAVVEVASHGVLLVVVVKLPLIRVEVAQVLVMVDVLVDVEVLAWEVVPRAAMAV